MNFRIAEDHEDPTHKSDPGVESKGPAWGHAFHHGQKGRSNDDIATPATDRIQHRSECADFDWQKLGSHPRNRSNARRKEGNVEDDCHKKDNTRPANCLGLDS